MRAWVAAVVLCPAAALGNELIAPAEPRASGGPALATKVTELCDELGRHLGLLSSDLVDFRFDGRTRHGRVSLGGGDDDTFALRIDGDFRFERDFARVRTHIELAVQGSRFTLALPEVQIAPASYLGTRYFELRLPIVEGRF